MKLSIPHELQRLISNQNIYIQGVELIEKDNSQQTPDIPTTINKEQFDILLVQLLKQEKKLIDEFTNQIKEKTYFFERGDIQILMDIEEYNNYQEQEHQLNTLIDQIIKKIFYTIENKGFKNHWDFVQYLICIQALTAIKTFQALVFNQEFKENYIKQVLKLQDSFNFFLIQKNILRLDIEMLTLVKTETIIQFIDSLGEHLRLENEYKQQLIQKNQYIDYKFLQIINQVFAFKAIKKPMILSSLKNFYKQQFKDFKYKTMNFVKFKQVSAQLNIKIIEQIQDLEKTHSIFKIKSDKKVIKQMAELLQDCCWLEFELPKEIFSIQLYNIINKQIVEQIYLLFLGVFEKVKLQSQENILLQKLQELITQKGYIKDALLINIQLKIDIDDTEKVQKQIKDQFLSIQDKLCFIDLLKTDVKLKIHLATSNLQGIYTLDSSHMHCIFSNLELLSICSQLDKKIVNYETIYLGKLQPIIELIIKAMMYRSYKYFENHYWRQNSLVDLYIDFLLQLQATTYDKFQSAKNFLNTIQKLVNQITNQIIYQIQSLFIYII